jgi:Glycosyl hydrolase family 76
MRLAARSAPHTCFTIGLALVLALTGTFTGSMGRVHAASKDHTNLDRAIASYQAMQTYLYLGPANHSLYLEEYPKQPSDNPYSYVWELREATAATVDMAGLPDVGGQYTPDVHDRLSALQNYWDSTKTPPGYDSYVPPPLGQGGDIYYDDNDVIGLELVRIYRATGDATVLDRAEQVFQLIKFGWDSDPSHPCPGGEQWTQGTWTAPIRATNATALGSEFALHLYQLTEQQSYLDWGKKMYEWNRGCVLSPQGLYWNDMDFQGNIDKTLWIYNDGAMIGAGALLYQITGDATYLQQAEGTADATMAYFGAGGRYYIQPAIFDAIFFKNLLLLDSIQHNPKYRQTMQAYADAIWQADRDPATGLFTFGASQPAQVLEHAAMVQIYAALAWDPKDDAGLA